MSPLLYSLMGDRYDDSAGDDALTDTMTCLEEFPLALLAEQRSPKTMEWYCHNIRRFADFVSPDGDGMAVKVIKDLRV